MMMLPHFAIGDPQRVQCLHAFWFFSKGFSKCRNGLIKLAQLLVSDATSPEYWSRLRAETKSFMVS